MPTHQQNLAFVREKIIQAVPEIVEPKLRSGFLSLVSHNGERFVTSYDVAINRSSVEDKWHLEILETLPRTIRIADVLRAIGQMEKSDWTALTKDHALFGVMDHGAFIWDLSQDDLSLQSEPTVALLAEVLK